MPKRSAGMPRFQMNPPSAANAISPPFLPPCRPSQYRASITLTLYHSITHKAPTSATSRSNVRQLAHPGAFPRRRLPRRAPLRKPLQQVIEHRRKKDAKNVTRSMPANSAVPRVRRISACRPDGGYDCPSRLDDPLALQHLQAVVPAMEPWHSRLRRNKKGTRWPATAS
jgi:hypothetical protein